MPLTRYNTRTFFRTLYGPGILEKIRLLKRGNDLKQGTVTVYTLFDCRRSVITKTGETYQDDMVSDHRTTWHIPKIELDRVGVSFISPLDRIVQLQFGEAGYYWQPEATTTITVKLMGNEIHIDCLRVDPPKSGG